MWQRCSYPGCTTISKFGRCALHARGTRPRPANRGYGKQRWRTLSARVLAKHPTCEACHNAPSAIAHHLDRLGPKGPRGYDPANIIALCRRCHADAHYRRN